MNLIEFLDENKIEYRLNEEMKNLINFKIGGKVGVCVFPSTVSSFVRLLKYLKQTKTLFYVLGNGTNMLCNDEKYNGVLVKLGTNLKGYKINGNKITAEAGLGLFELNEILLKNSLEGLEFSYGIPGSVGGAIFMNAGAFGHTVSEYIKSIKVFDGEKIRTIKPSELNFEHRKSLIEEKKLVVLSADFVLKKGKFEEIEKKQTEIITYRRQTQPYEMPSAGSVFKRLDNGLTPVSKIIDELGLKGKSFGDAEVSMLHAGFIVNKGKATCKNVKDLIKYIKLQVKEKYGYDLEQEIIELGENDGIIW